MIADATGGWRPYALLTIFCAILFIPGIASLPPLDRDEARFAQATAQMLETGDYVDIRFQDQPRHKKPAGIHWLQAASVQALSSIEAREIWAYRVPSVIGAWAAVIMTFVLGAHLFGRTAGLIAGGMMAASALLILEAHQAKTDAVLLACVVAAQAGLAHAYLAARDKLSVGRAPIALMWIGLGAGVMIKGPIAPLITVLTAAALSLADRDWRWLGRLGWLWGLPLATAMALPWYMAVGGGAGGGDGGFVMTAITTDLIPKLLGGQESHGAPPGYYAVLALLFFWPGVFLMGPALWRAWRDRTAAPVRFCLAWLVPAWIMFELIPTKLPHYVLPLYPALALICAWSAAAVIGGAAPWFNKRALWITGGLWALIGLALGAAAVYLPIHFGATATWHTWFFVLFPLYALVTSAAAMKHHVMNEALENAVISGGIMVTMVLWLMVAGFQPMWVSARAADTVPADIRTAAPVAVAGFSEPSIVFRLGTKTELTNGAGAAGLLKSGQATAAIVEARELGAFKDSMGGLLGRYRVAGIVSGINYSKGKKVALHIFLPAGDSAK